MLSPTDYNIKINAIFSGYKHPPFTNYIEYKFYENEWIEYYKNIFLTYKPTSNQIPFRIIIMESCPEGQFPHPNYIFSNLCNTLNGITDRYLAQIYKGFFKLKKKITKKQALIELAKLNVLIVDILPSHGMTLDSRITRPNVNRNPLLTCDLDKINNIIVEANSTVNTVFSMPPSINYLAINTYLLPNICFGTMTSGSGFPSFNLLKTHIAKGF